MRSDCVKKDFLVLFVLMVVFFMAANNVFSKSAGAEVDATIEVDMGGVLVEDFLGAGVQWSAYPWFDVSESDWEKVFKRVDYLKLPFVRIMVDMTSFFAGLDENGEPQYLFDCELMQRVYKLLDYCECNNVIVMVGQWGWSNTAKHREGENWNFSPDSAMHTRISADYINHLLNVKGYKCIRWYDMINEPDGSWSS